MRVPGVYQALIDDERADRDRYGDRITTGDGHELAVMWADPDDHSAGFFRCWDDHLLCLLEAGKPVIMRKSAVALALWQRDRPPRPVKLPFERSVRFVQINPDDTIVPARDLDPHVDGRAVRVERRPVPGAHQTPDDRIVPAESPVVDPIRPPRGSTTEEP
jgi:hypothetical protein